MNNSRLLIVVGAVFCLVNCACERTGSPGDQAALCQEMRVSSGNISLTISASGTVEPAATVLVGPRVGGRIVEILVQEGDHVEEGQPLVKMERSTQFVQYLIKVKHELNKARLHRESTVTDLERAKELVSAGLRPPMHVEDLERKLSAFELEEKVALEKWNEIERVVGKSISPGFDESDLSTVINTELTSPISGTVQEIMVRRGENILPGQAGSMGQRGGAALAIADVSRPLLIARVSEIDINHLACNQSVELHFDSLPGMVFPGKLRRIESFGSDRMALQGGPSLNRRGLGRFDVEIEMEKTDPSIRPGLSFEAVFLIEEKNNIILVPIEAVLKDGESPFIFVKDRQSIRLRRISTGLSNAASVEVLSGLKVGETVCRDAHAYLGSSAHVQGGG